MVGRSRGQTGGVAHSRDPAGAGRVSRRAVLTGAALLGTGVAAGSLAVDEGVLPGRSWIYRHFGPQGTPGVVPAVTPGRSLSGTLVSQARLGTRCGWTIAFPPGGGENLPVAVVLHGRGFDHASAFDPAQLGLDRFQAVAVQQGSRPFALASVDGGDTYWHPRDSGEDAGALVLDEFLPLLASHGLDVARIGLLGWSMGGYGALALAGRLGRDRVAGVAAMSPALWQDFDDTAPGAFDDAEDFAAATVFGREHQLDGIPVRIDCGAGDPFYAATHDYVESLDDPPSGGFEPGNHDLGYWRRMAPVELRFLARSFSARPA